MTDIAPWFQIALGKDDASWLFNDNGSFWANTSAETLSSLIALHLLQRDFGNLLNGPGLLRSFFSGGAGNKAAEAFFSEGDHDKGSPNVLYHAIRG